MALEDPSTRRIETLTDLPRDLQLIWHGVNDPKNLEYFLKSDIYWAEGDLREQREDRLVLRHDPFDSHPLVEGEALLDFRDWLGAVFGAGRGIQIDLKEGGRAMERMIDIVKGAGVPADRLWFTTNLKDVPMDDYARLGQAFPGARLQSAIPIRFMFQDMIPAERGAWLEINRGLGVTDLSMSWYDEPTAEQLDEIHKQGFSVNIFYVNTLEEIRRAVLMGPDSLTSDFHIPEWGLFGRGSGENGFYLEKT